MIFNKLCSGEILATFGSSTEVLNAADPGWPGKGPLRRVLQVVHCTRVPQANRENGGRNPVCTLLAKQLLPSRGCILQNRTTFFYFNRGSVWGGGDADERGFSIPLISPKKQTTSSNTTTTSSQESCPCLKAVALLKAANWLLCLSLSKSSNPRHFLFLWLKMGTLKWERPRLEFQICTLLLLKKTWVGRFTSLNLNFLICKRQKLTICISFVVVRIPDDNIWTAMSILWVSSKC